ncbi:glycosyltransferase [Paucibacter sp. AS339]|uniref:glycosyltransferase n=1 Tax=Paucibacter hankyongi TaxID=3133434 RepID=UPI0030A11EE5
MTPKLISDQQPLARLLFVTKETHPSFRADVRVLFGKYLPRMGIASDLFTQAEYGQASTPWAAGALLLAPSSAKSWLRPLQLLRHDLRLFTAARSGDYAAVQVRDRIFAGALGLSAARRAGLPFFYWASYPKPESRKEAADHLQWTCRPLHFFVHQLRARLSDALLYRWVLRRADHVFVQSEAMLAAFAARGLPTERMSAVPMGVDLEEAQAQEPAPPEVLARVQGRRVLVYAGALDRVRQPRLMLEAMVHVKAAMPDSLLLMVGGALDPADLQQLQQSAEDLALQPWVQFTGWVSPAQALACMRLGELGLSTIPRGPLYDVSSPTKLAEYFALGLPVVANDLPDQALVMRESEAGVCVPFEPRALAEAALALLNSPEQARQQGLAGQRYIAAQRSYAALAERLAQTYRRLLA